MIFSRSLLNAIGEGDFERSLANHLSRSMSPGKRASVFLSHKHDEANTLLQVTYLLEQIHASVYVDWQDRSMPDITCGLTAERIKEKIKQYDKFILVATDGAIASKWCNWELGYGDAQKYAQKKIALFPIKEDNRDWTGSEYMELYPTIEIFDGHVRCEITNTIPQANFYVVYHFGNKRIIPLEDWLNQ